MHPHVRDDAHDGRIGAVESVEDYTNRTGKSAVLAKEIGAGEQVGQASHHAQGRIVGPGAGGRDRTLAEDKGVDLETLVRA